MTHGAGKGDINCAGELVKKWVVLGVILKGLKTASINLITKDGQNFGSGGCLHEQAQSVKRRQIVAWQC